MMDSRELLQQITKFDEEYLESHYTAPEEMFTALKARISNELEVAAQLAHALTLVQCICVREFKYSGKGVVMCFKCRAMVLYETLTTGESPTQKEFDRVRP